MRERGGGGDKKDSDDSDGQERDSERGKEGWYEREKDR